jgi:hypothetical protein
VSSGVFVEDHLEVADVRDRDPGSGPLAQGERLVLAASATLLSQKLRVKGAAVGTRKTEVPCHPGD